MGRALADPAIGDGLFAAVYSLTAVEGLQFVGGLEGAVFRNRLSPGDVGRAGDVAAALGAFLGKVLGGQQLAAVFGGGPDVHQIYAAVVDLAQHLVTVGPDVLIGRFGRVGLGAVIGRIGGEGFPFGFPLGASAVHQLDVVVAVVLQLPEGPSGKPVVVVTVENDRGVVVDSRRTQQVLQFVLADQVPANRGLKLRLPVPTHRAGDVALVVGRRVYTHFHQPYVVIAAVRSHPISVHQRFWMCVVCHDSPC